MPSLAKYERLSTLLLKARLPVKYAPEGYNGLLADVWLRLYQRKRVPTFVQFDEALADAYDLIRDAMPPKGKRAAAAFREALLAAKVAVDAVYQEAQRVLDV
jgi:hypothetical protein